MVGRDGTFIGNFAHIPGVLNNGEAGLEAMALHPKFSENGRFFVVSIYLSISISLTTSIHLPLYRRYPSFRSICSTFLPRFLCSLLLSGR